MNCDSESPLRERGTLSLRLSCAVVRTKSPISGSVSLCPGPRPGCGEALGSQPLSRRGWRRSVRASRRHCVCAAGGGTAPWGAVFALGSARSSRVSSWMRHLSLSSAADWPEFVVRSRPITAGWKWAGAHRSLGQPVPAPVTINTTFINFFKE